MKVLLAITAACALLLSSCSANHPATTPEQANAQVSSQSPATQKSPVPASGNTTPVTPKPALTPPVSTTRTPVVTAVTTPNSPPPSIVTPSPSQTHVIVRISAEELKKKLDSGSSIVLVDVRSKLDFNMNHLAGAVNIPLQELPNRYAEVPRAGEIVVYAACN